MDALIDFGQKYFVTIASVLTALAVIWKTIGLPVRQLVKSYSDLQRDVSDLMWDRLAQGHEHYLEQGWATSAEKGRMCTIYRHYKAAGRNHLADTYESDIMGLPEHPAERG